MSPLSSTDQDRIAELYAKGVSYRAILAEMPPGTTENQIRGRVVHSNLHRPPQPELVRPLAEDNLAVIEGRTSFPTRVRSPRVAPAVLVPGNWSTKLGGKVERGGLRGAPIFSLTLEERATCPRSCHVWSACYGNGMPFAWRTQHGLVLEVHLQREIAALSRRYPGGFLVRLHQLGDFYSVDYVNRWAGWIDEFPALHVFGFTARSPDSDIGAAVARLAAARWNRFAVRWSARSPGPARAMTLWTWPDDGGEKRRDLARSDIIVCPAQTGAAKSCGTCGLCWSAPDKTIAFIAHGPQRGTKR